MSPAHQEPSPHETWLRAFHAGDKACLESCYREHFDAVDRTVGMVLAGADRETVVHEVFYRLLSDPALRASFTGGTFPAWLRVVARNHAVDYARRRRHEVCVDEAARAQSATDGRVEQRVDVHLFLERFRSQILPKKWERVFVARFLEQQDQPTAARALGMRRTTLAYQEYRIRALLRRFFLRGELP